MAMRIAELRKSECCPVIGQIEVALPFWDNITSPETEQPAGWSRPVSHAGRHAHVRRHRRLRARPLGAGAHAPHGTPARGARGRGATHALQEIDCLLFAPGSSLAARGPRLPSGKRTAISPSRNSHARTMKSTRWSGRRSHCPSRRNLESPFPNPVSKTSPASLCSSCGASTATANGVSRSSPR